jgi:predicted CoA-substrate-specific enzyme activase
MMSCSLGLDIGSVTAKVALVAEDGGAVYFDTEKITASPRSAVASLISRLSEEFNLQEITTAGVSGPGSVAIPKELDWAEYSSSLAIASGLLHSHPDAKTIIQIGGQSSFVIALVDGLRKPWQVASNPLCAAGTGRFLEQQAYRIGVTLEDFARLALECEGSPPRIAARCSVFAKTDLIHLQQKGVPMAAMLYALCESIARMVASLKKGIFEEPIYFVGGVAANSAMLRTLNEALSARNGYPADVIVPENYLHIEAIGSALLSRESGKSSKVIVLTEEDSTQRYYKMPRLEKVTQQDGWAAPKIEEPFTGYLGVDIGSTSTKAVIVDELGTEVVAKNYLMTAGRPVEAIKDVFRNLLRDVGDNPTIAGVGVTGSGRYLVGSFIGADVIRNEITAQTRAAAEIDAEADIIEIGGQDSKLVIKRNGVVVDYQMNKACAAGTGSFIDELAEQLGVRVQNGDFAALAFEAPHTIDLGSRCAAFMGQSVALAQQEGVPLEVITASLANSIAGNYLSKVLGTRKLGDKVMLTGAVFYNDAVVSAFRRALEGKTILVAEHRDVSGAIGAALLAKEEMDGRASKFKGFQKVVESDYKLSTFTCKRCDNNCAISRMEISGEKPTFYGSRCDLFDSTVSREKMETPFDERERLLFKAYREGEGTGPVVGIPRALMVYDYAPLLIGFLNALGAKVVLSSKTNNQIMGQAVELSYTDSCFPIKLLHGHAASLNNVDYILYPCVIRMGVKEGDENQKYACPLVQASPFIIHEALGIGKRLLIPIIDFSRGDADVIKNFTNVAVKMGFGGKEGKKAALSGIAAQREFEAAEVELGKELMARLHRTDQLGVVLFSRSYMSQDSGANLGIAEKLAQLGVMPIPLDYLSLGSVNVREYSDRPYWFNESKHIAGAALTAADPQLFGLVLTNFGCGPNSFILNLVEDIMGGKPLGQLEIDEHAAEAGIVTRLEAFVDTINSFANSSRASESVDQGRDIRRVAYTKFSESKIVLLPRMCEHADVLAAAMQAFGVEAVVLPEPDERNILYSNKVTSGKECLPYRVTLGSFMRLLYGDDNGGVDLKDVEGFMAGAFGPCRFGKYAVEQIRILRELGFDFPIRTTVSNHGYHDSNLGAGFERLAWRGIVAVDYLERLLWRTRPYEKSEGAAEALFNEYLLRVADLIRRKETFDDIIREAAPRFRSVLDPSEPRRPLVGINGEIFLRSNKFSNSDLVRECEKVGLEVIVSPIAEWFKYITHRNIEDGIRDRDLKRIIKGHIRKLLLNRDERSVAANFADFVEGKDPTIEELLRLAGRYLSPKCGGEAILSTGAGIEWLEDPRFAGVISVMPHGCMPGGIVAAMSEKLSEKYGKPWISLTYDGILETNNQAKISNFAEIIRYSSRDGLGSAL